MKVQQKRKSDKARREIPINGVSERKLIERNEEYSCDEKGDIPEEVTPG